MITGINESRTLARYISCKCECKFDRKNVIWIKNGISISVGVSVKIQEKILCEKKGYFWNPKTCSCKNG